MTLLDLFQSGDVPLLELEGEDLGDERTGEDLTDDLAGELVDLDRLRFLVLESAVNKAIGDLKVTGDVDLSLDFEGLRSGTWWDPE